MSLPKSNVSENAKKINFLKCGPYWFLKKQTQWVFSTLEILEQWVGGLSEDLYFCIESLRKHYSLTLCPLLTFPNSNMPYVDLVCSLETHS